MRIGGCCMARLSITPDDDLLRKLDVMADVDSIQKKMLRAAAPHLLRSVSNRLRAHKRSGNLDRSLKISKPKRTKKDKKYYVMIAPEGYDERRLKNGGVDRVSNAQKMMALEYGTKKQTATPFISAATRDAEGAVVQAMRDVFEQEVSK